MPQLENNLPELEKCSLRQALDWIYHKKSPIAENFEQIIRTNKERWTYGTTGDNDISHKHDTFLNKLLSGEVKLFATNGTISDLSGPYGHHFDYEPVGEERQISISDITFNCFDWDNSAIYNLPNIRYDDEGLFDGYLGMPISGLVNIRVLVSEIKTIWSHKNNDYTEPLLPVYKDTYELVYNKNTHALYFKINTNTFRYKTLSDTDTKYIFEFLYANPNKVFTLTEILNNIPNLTNLKQGDSLSQYAINLITIPGLRERFFPDTTRNQIQFVPTFTIESESNIDINSIDF